MVTGVGTPEGYRAAREGVGISGPRPREVVAVIGKAPGEMLKGVVTSRIPAEPSEKHPGVWMGESVYSAILTPKGKMITDLRIMATSQGGLLLDLPREGAGAARAHFTRFLPPRMARVVDPPVPLAILTLVGPRGPALLAGEAEGFLGAPALAAAAGLLESLTEGEELRVEAAFGELRVRRNADLDTPALDLLLPAAAAAGVVEGLGSAGAEPVGEETLDVLRVEKGRPAWGKDMDTEVIPVEAGIHNRAIDYQKGCYTGQETIIRVRDRGQVNKHLRGLLLGEAGPPAPGVELFAPDREKPVGWITSSCVSPRFGQTVALGYLRREVGPGADVGVETRDGPVARVRALGDEGWG